MAKKVMVRRSVGNQTIAFGALTASSAGGAKALNAALAEVDFVSVDSQGAGSGWEVSSVIHAAGPGRLIRSTGTPASQNGVVLTCTVTGGYSISATIQSSGTDAMGRNLAASAHVAPGAGQLDAAVTAADTADDGRTIICRYGDYTTQLATAGTVLKDVALTVRMTIESERASPYLASFSSIDVRGATTAYITLKNLESTGTVSIVNGAGASQAGRIIIDGIYAHGTAVPLTGAYTTDYNAMTQYGITSSGGSSAPAHVEVKNCNVEYFKDGIVFTVTGTLVISTNTVRYTYGDAFKLVEAASGHPTSVLYSGNIAYGFLAKEVDPPAIHTDGFQVNGSASNAADWTGVIYEDNLVFLGGTRGDEPQGIFEDDKQIGTYCDGWILRRNIVVSGTNHIMTIRDAKACVVEDAIAVRYPSAAGTIASIFIGDRQSSGTHTVTNSVHETISVAGSPTLSGNTELGTGGATIAYEDFFVGPFTGLTTPAAVLAAYTPL
jgi:hypothetical protein